MNISLRDCDCRCFTNNYVCVDIFYVPYQILTGQSHEIFDPRFFSLNGTPGCPDLWAKAVLNTDSNSRRNSIRFNYEKSTPRNTA
jgi:hypothetical protein